MEILTKNQRKIWLYNFNISESDNQYSISGNDTNRVIPVKNRNRLPFVVDWQLENHIEKPLQLSFPFSV